MEARAGTLVRLLLTPDGFEAECEIKFNKIAIKRKKK